MSPHLSWWRPFAVVAFALATAGAGAAGATEVRFFRLQSRDAFLAGTFDGVSVDELGTLSLADRVARLSELGEPFLFSAAPHPEGWVVGTGNAGKVLLVARSGEVRTLFEAPEPEIFAVWADPDGTVFAGSSPRGKVYRITADGGEVYFEPGEIYVWDLKRARDGALLVATGTAGKLYRVTAGGKGSVLYDSEDTHVRVLQPLPDGSVLAGTAGEGLILRISEGGFARTLYDAAQPEVVSLALGDDGVSYAAVLASEASLLDLSDDDEGEREGGTARGDEDREKVRVSVGAAPGQRGFTGSRPQGYQGPRSEVLRLTPQGRVESLWRFDSETVYTLRFQRGRLWVGTGLEGKLYSLRGRKMVLEKDVDERQVVVLLDDRPGPAFATANATALYRVSGARERQGSFTSPALDAGQIAEFGGLRWHGSSPRGARVEFSFRSGVSAEPDRTWSPWTEAATGPEIPLDQVPPGRYVQWRAVLSATEGRSPELSQVTVSYRQINLPPRIESFVALDPGEILVPANFNPANNVFEPVHPNREGIFTRLEPDKPGRDLPRKTLWKQGYRTLRWEAEDPNGDDLEYELSFRAQGADDGWLAMADGVEEDFYSFDATALPDGTYRFRLRASDRGGGDAARALIVDEISEPVLVDHSASRLVEARRQDGGLRVVVEDALSPLRRAEYSVDAGGWRPARPEDGIVDGRREVLLVEAPEEAKMVLLRLVDASFNIVTFDLLGELR